MKTKIISLLKYVIFFNLLTFSYFAAAADTGLIDYNKILNKNAAVSEYTNEVDSLKIKVMNDYDTLDSLRDAIIDDTKNRDARDKLAAELADKEAQIVKDWLVGLQKINAKFIDMALEGPTSTRLQRYLSTVLSSGDEIAKLLSHAMYRHEFVDVTGCTGGKHITTQPLR